MNIKIGDIVQCKQTRIDWEISDISTNGFNEVYILKSTISQIEVPAEQLDTYFDRTLKLYQSLAHMITKDDVDFLNKLANRLKNHPIIDSLGDNYIDKLLSIANNN